MRIRSIAASLLSLAAVPLLAGGALASHTSVAALSGDAGERVIFNDANGEATASVDIARVTASLVGEHDDRVRLKVAFAQIQKSGDHTAVYFDRNRSNPGPELRLSGIVGSEFWLDRVDGWNDRGRPARCEFSRMHQDRSGWVMTASIDRDCLDSRHVRFEVRTTAWRDGSTDWLDRARRFSTYSPA